MAGYMNCSLLGSGRAGGELLPSQYMHIGDGALVPEMCVREVRVPAMREAEEHTILKHPFHRQYLNKIAPKIAVT